MADNTTLNAGSGGDVYGSDDISSVKYQRVKLIHGIDGVNDGDVAKTNPFPVVVYKDQQRRQITSAGLTTASTTYSAGDQVGTIFDVTTAARASGGAGMITGVTLIDEQNVVGGYDVMFFDSTVTLASDNAAFAISDADSLKAITLVQLGGAYALGNQRLLQAFNLAIPYTLNGGTSMYAALITRAAHTFFNTTGASNFKLTVHFERYS